MCLIFSKIKKIIKLKCVLGWIFINNNLIFKMLIFVYNKKTLKVILFNDFKIFFWKIFKKYFCNFDIFIINNYVSINFFQKNFKIKIN